MCIRKPYIHIYICNFFKVCKCKILKEEEFYLIEREKKEKEGVPVVA